MNHLQLLIEKLIMVYTSKLWDNLDKNTYSYTEINIKIFKLLQNMNTLRIRCTCVPYSVLITLHESEYVEWVDVTDNNNILTLIQELLVIDKDGECDMNYSTKELSLCEQSKIYEYVFSEDDVTRAALIYDGDEWSVAFIRHLFNNVKVWDKYDYAYGINVLGEIIKEVGMTKGLETLLNELGLTL